MSEAFVIHMELAVHGLVQMAGIAFMGQCGVKGQGIGAVFVVDVNDICAHIVYRRCQIVGGTGIIFHRFRHPFDRAGGEKLLSACGNAGKSGAICS